MHLRSAVFAVAICLLCSVARADSLSSLTPDPLPTAQDADTAVIQGEAAVVDDLQVNAQAVQLQPMLAITPNAAPPLNSPVPEPSTFLLLSTGLLGVAGAMRKRRNA